VNVSPSKMVRLPNERPSPAACRRVTPTTYTARLC
jgi:hypothetical protein